MVQTTNNRFIINKARSFNIPTLESSASKIAKYFESSKSIKDLSMLDIFQCHYFDYSVPLIEQLRKSVLYYALPNIVKMHKELKVSNTKILVNNLSDQLKNLRVSVGINNKYTILINNGYDSISDFFNEADENEYCITFFSRVALVNYISQLPEESELKILLAISNYHADMNVWYSNATKILKSQFENFNPQ